MGFDDVYMHCKVTVAVQMTTDHRCAKGCEPSKRKRRSMEEDMSVNLYVGPLKPRPWTNEPGEEGEKDKNDEESTIEKSEKESSKKMEEEEPDFELLENPARVLPAQCSVWLNIGGIVMMTDSKSDEPEDLIEPLPASSPMGIGAEEDEEEPEPPEPFEYIDED
ncbi:26S proteasome non-ATPase regulatory subunit 1 [Desmophyllum pertusum]|uniref:26S proteasome non-ATPase regulatory subunit 1 n=1 Tax=Desmophyllum pertusum TaxID=174260 RepID=A0A9X0CIQ2_9CNID|nr:26S proteasome non-ATPase regulatory subunit 1 [Desmophyllum pertusum]